MLKFGLRAATKTLVAALFFWGWQQILVAALIFFGGKNKMQYIRITRKG